MKRCTTCKKDKRFSEFHKAVKAKDGYNWECKSCKSERMRLLNAKPERKAVRRAKGLERYGLTPEEYDLKLQEQHGCCAMCGKHWTNFEKRLHVDHNHITKKNRGLLCPGCNVGLGILEMPDFIIMAAKYLSKHGDKIWYEDI